MLVHVDIMKNRNNFIIASVSFFLLQLLSLIQKYIKVFESKKKTQNKGTNSSFFRTFRKKIAHTIELEYPKNPPIFHRALSSDSGSFPPHK